MILLITLWCGFGWFLDLVCLFSVYILFRGWCLDLLMSFCVSGCLVSLFGGTVRFRCGFV